MRRMIKRTIHYLFIPAVVCIVVSVFVILVFGRRSVDLKPDVKPYVDPSARLAKSFQNRTKKVNPGSFEFLIKGQDICGGPRTRPYLVIIIITAHRNREARNSIRQTWGGHAVSRSWPHRHVDEDVRLAFLLGRSAFEQENEQLKRESEEFHDVIQGEFLDTYANLSRKTLLGLRWSSLYCPAQFVLKADDDTLVHIPDLLDLLRLNPPKVNGTLYGDVSESLQPLRSGKYALSYKEYAYDWFPKFLHGPAYIVSGNVVPKLVNASEYVHFIKLEDVYVTGWIASAVSAEKVDVPMFIEHYTGVYTGACGFWRRDFIVAHNVSSMAMRFIWKGVQYNIQGCRPVTIVLFLVSLVLLVLFVVIIRTTFRRHRTFIYSIGAKFKIRFEQFLGRGQLNSTSCTV